MTPLLQHLACSEGHLTIVEFLLERKADINCRYLEFPIQLELQLSAMQVQLEVLEMISYCFLLWQGQIGACTIRGCSQTWTCSSSGIDLNLCSSGIVTDISVQRLLRSHGSALDVTSTAQSMCELAARYIPF